MSYLFSMSKPSRVPTPYVPDLALEAPYLASSSLPPTPAETKSCAMERVAVRSDAAEDAHAIARAARELTVPRGAESSLGAAHGTR